MKPVTPLRIDDIWEALESVMDPEIPVVGLVEMGIIRDVVVAAGRVTVTMTPTFSGCPALEVMRSEIEHCVRALGVDDVVVETTLYPPWSTDWISEDAREKLRAFGLAPPPRVNGQLADVAFFETAVCPRCNSKRTSLRNSFGPTLCRMIWYCHDCQDAFEQFKPL